MLRLNRAENGQEREQASEHKAGHKCDDQRLPPAPMLPVHCLLDAFHGISPFGNGLISSYLPDLTQPGAVKKGEVELVAGVALKNTLKAAQLTGIAIEPKTT